MQRLLYTSTAVLPQPEGSASAVRVLVAITQCVGDSSKSASRQMWSDGHWWLGRPHLSDSTGGGRSTASGRMAHLLPLRLLPSPLLLLLLLLGVNHI